MIVLLLLAGGYAQQSGDVYIVSLQMPCYPPLARQARVQGNVKLKVALAEDGTVASVQALEGNPLLRTAAADNVRTWKFGAGQRMAGLSKIVDFNYKLADESGLERCASRVSFESFEVSIVGHAPVEAIEALPSK